MPLHYPTNRLALDPLEPHEFKVFIVTGGYSGIGFELCQILYEHNAIVYIAGRSQTKASSAIALIRSASPKSSGRLEFLFMDLYDFASVKSGTEIFMKNESRLDVLVNNAGVMFKGSSETGYHEKQIATNCVGPSLLYRLLLPLLVKTANISPTGTVRVLWAGSIAVHINAPKPSGMELDDNGRPNDTDVLTSYGQRKVGNVFLARHYAKKTTETGIVHSCFNPGNLRSELQRHWAGIDIWLMVSKNSPESLNREIQQAVANSCLKKKLLFFPPIYGAYTELWAAISPELTPDHSGSYVYPWGRFGSIPVGVEESMKDESSGRPGVATKFISWFEKQTKAFI